MTIQTSDKLFFFTVYALFQLTEVEFLNLFDEYIMNYLILRDWFLTVFTFFSVRERMNRFTRWVIFCSFAYQLSTINKLTWCFRFDIGPVYLLEQTIFFSGSELSHKGYLPIPPDEAASCSLTLSRCRDPKIISNFLSASTENQTRFRKMI